MSVYCTRNCAGNKYSKTGDPGEIIDHLLFKGPTLQLKAGTGMRFIDDEYEISTGVTQHLSDHYGVKATFEYNDSSAFYIQKLSYKLLIMLIFLFFFQY